MSTFGVHFEIFSSRPGQLLLQPWLLVGTDPETRGDESVEVDVGTGAVGDPSEAVWSRQSEE